MRHRDNQNSPQSVTINMRGLRCRTNKHKDALKVPRRNKREHPTPSLQARFSLDSIVAVCACLVRLVDLVEFVNLFPALLP